MAYIQKEKFNIYDLVASTMRATIVVIVEPDVYLGNLYKRYISAENLETHLHDHLAGLQVMLEKTQPHVLVINPQIHPSLKLFLASLEDIRDRHPQIIIITIDRSSDPEALKHYMNAGIASHVNRTLSRPQDLAVIIKNLLQH